MISCFRTNLCNCVCCASKAQDPIESVQVETKEKNSKTEEKSQIAPVQEVNQVNQMKDDTI